MQLGYTIPLQRHLKMKSPPYGSTCDLRFCWELHMLKLSGKASLIAVHGSSRYTLLLYHLRPADWKRLPELFGTELRRCLADEGFSQGGIDEYFTQAGEMEVTKTHGRRPVAFLNRAVDDLYGIPVSLDGASQQQPQVIHFLNEVICHAEGYEEYGTGREFLYRDFASLGIRQVL